MKITIHLKHEFIPHSTAYTSNLPFWELQLDIWLRKLIREAQWLEYYIWYEHSSKENESVFETDGKHLSLVPWGVVGLWDVQLSKWPGFDLGRFVTSYI